ncbi:hypothetical protein BHOIPH791_09650 [Bartonella henselae]|nr:hypothetical protein BH623125_05580 [Bartonella henselae]GFF04531.1 hypothetical protein BH80429_13520 [Bartonella henselae]
MKFFQAVVREWYGIGYKKLDLESSRICVKKPHPTREKEEGKSESKVQKMMKSVN